MLPRPLHSIFLTTEIDIAFDSKIPILNSHRKVDLHGQDGGGKKQNAWSHFVKQARRKPINADFVGYLETF